MSNIKTLQRKVVTDKYRLRQGDCLELLKDIEDNSIDLIIADLPYNCTRNDWDQDIIDLDKLWEQYNRIAKQNACIVMFGQGIFSAKLIGSQVKQYRYTLIWEKTNPTGFLNAKRMPLRSHDDILVFYRKLPTYNPQYFEGEPLHGMGKSFRTKENTSNNYGAYDHRNNPTANRAGDTKKFPRSILKFKKPHPAIHPTQKPHELIEWIIKSYTNDDEPQTVLDCTFGSCTTGIACLNTGRYFEGIELDDKYFNLGVGRMKDRYDEISYIESKNTDEEQMEFA